MYEGETKRVYVYERVEQRECVYVLVVIVISFLCVYAHAFVARPNQMKKKERQEEDEKMNDSTLPWLS